VLFFFFYFFNFLRISYIEASYNLFAFLSDIIDITLINVGFKMLINPEMDPNKNSTCLKKGYVLGFFVVLNNIIWKLILFKFNIKLIIANKEETNILILNIFTIVVMIAGWSWGYKKLWYNKYIMSIFCFLLVGIYITLVCKILHNQYNLFRFI
jgi:hypothetical protein